VRPPGGALVALFVLALTAHSFAYTIVVDQGGSGDFTTIGGGLGAATSGDTVLVLPGTYTGEGNRELSFGSKALVLKSTAGPEETILDLEGHAGIEIDGSSHRFRAVSGFTITHGGGDNDPAMLCYEAWALIDSCVFVENSLDDWGTAVTLAHCTSATVSACRFVRNKRAISATSAWGGSVLITGCDFVENGAGPAAPGNGGIWLSVGRGNAIVQSCTFERNEASGNGGAVRYSGGGAIILDCHFSGNRSGDGGGAIYANAYSGTQSGHPKIWSSTFTDNHADSRGGAIGRVGASPDISGCVFTGNTAPLGGAVYLRYDHENQFPARIDDSSFFDNEAERGGAVYLEDTGSLIRDCDFIRNRATMWGGGVCWTESSDFTANVLECTFAANASHRGGAVFSDYAPMYMAGCTFFGNRSDDGSVTSLRDHFSRTTEIRNCIITFESSGTPVHCQLSAPEVSHCVLFGNASGDDLCGDAHDNLILDPLFCDAYGDDFTLCANSPCLPENNVWGEPVGRFGAGCGDCENAVHATSWGAIKAMYRRR
jgi:predicted outer membrane repeat protein